MQEELSIKGQPAAQTDVFFFTTSVPLIHHNLTVECHNNTEAKGSLLFEKIFSLPWVVHAAAEGRALIVKKTSESPPWNELASKIAELLRDLYRGEHPFFSPDYLDKIRRRYAENASESSSVISSSLGKAINDVLQKKILPSLAMHGGTVAMVGLRDGIVELNFSGGCQGCSQVDLTLRGGIEKLLKDHFTEIREVRDITNHAAGRTPFFSK